jgi:hypothetical protein
VRWRIAARFARAGGTLKMHTPAVPLASAAAGGWLGDGALVNPAEFWTEHALLETAGDGGGDGGGGGGGDGGDGGGDRDGDDGRDGGDMDGDGDGDDGGDGDGDDGGGGDGDGSPGMSQFRSAAERLLRWGPDIVVAVGRLGKAEVRALANLVPRGSTPLLVSSLGPHRGGGCTS